MTFFNRARFLALSFALSFAVAALAFGAAIQAQEPGKNPVVALVDGAEIRLSDVEAVRGQLPPQAQNYPMETLFNFIIGNMVNTRLVAAEARRTGLNDNAAVKRRLASIEAQVLEQEFMNRKLEGAVTDAALQARYQEFLKENAPGEEVHARHILVKTEAAAKAIIKQLQGGADFEKLAKEKSTGPSGKNGGDLGYFTFERMVPPFSKAAFQLKPGSITQAPVKTRFGWHIIKSEDKRATKPPSFAATKTQMAEEVRKNFSDEIIEGLKKNAKIEIFGPQGRQKK
ncbi:MAG: peptidylprolyl isomerase [Rhodospirillaceae bacterium]|jgi:peptidyl-prolyl cis-trans isomerase C|nr:peptidylprolyl isomerase [Rhodospirillaceae bacterium]MBT3883991.1 peptidylprolyl isomerase [Rhodospirillaceae bacterium]MBT4671780.1 peptidylprolyl isomerase [Rhodospirillaceae bacterium]MBT4750813.1 peptidylprolyl isomerase [Rhodospirillaceae bacterium]MBT5838132.1 peptidylprolyl isomerase [Rhodospirillaceae bacterium]